MTNRDLIKELLNYNLDATIDIGIHNIGFPFLISFESEGSKKDCQNISLWVEELNKSVPDSEHEKKSEKSDNSCNDQCKKNRKYVFNSFLDREDLPLGLRNNNPGNLRRTTIPWKGEIPDPKNKGKGFERFEFVEYGIRAMAIDLIGDIKKDGLNTIEKLITEYAPPNENDTQSYIKHVCQDTGLTFGQELKLTEGLVMALLNSIMDMELGTPANLITSEMIRKGVSMINSGARAYLE